MGMDPELARGSLRISLGSPRRRADIDQLLAALPEAVARARRVAQGDSPAAAGRRRERPDMRVLAALSGGVDSAVAAARMVAAGHDVTAVHLALSRNPETYRSGARGCCSLEDSRDAWRVADLLGHPVLRLGPVGAVRRRGGRRLPRRVRRRAHPEPVHAVQREDQVRRRARPGPGAGLRRGVHRALRPPGRRARRAASCTVRSTPPRTSPTCSECSTRASWPGACSRSASGPSRRCAQHASELGPGGGGQARQPRHLLHPQR